MKVYDIKCPYCGANLHVDGKSRFAVCAYCDSHVALEMDPHQAEAEAREQRRQEEERIEKARQEERARMEAIHKEKERAWLERSKVDVKTEERKRNAAQRREEEEQRRLQLQWEALCSDVEREKARIKKRRKWLILLSIILVPYGIIGLFSSNFMLGVGMLALVMWRWKSYTNKMAAQDARLNPPEK